MKKILYPVLILITIISIFPLYVIFNMSTYYSEDIFKGIPLFPSNYLLHNLHTIMQTNFFQAYVNSFIVSITAVVLCTIVSSMIGYAVTKFNFKGKKFFTYFIIVTMMVPSQISIIGYVLEMRSLHLSNSLFALIACWVGFPFGAFFMMQFMKDSVPNELIECARLDGCTEPGIFFKVVLPLIKPGIATLATLVFLWSWNNFMLPLIIINKQSLYTIPVLVSTLGTAQRTDYGARMCALSLSIFPVIAMFLMGSKSLIKGLTAGAVKG